MLIGSDIRDRQMAHVASSFILLAEAMAFPDKFQYGS